MNSTLETLIDQIMGANNEQRKAAEAVIKQNRSENAENFLSQLVQVGTAADETRASFSLLLLKKQYLDERPEEVGQWAIT